VTEYTLSPLGDEHDISTFACGEESLDRWLSNEALAAQRSWVSRTHVWTEFGASEVLAYFTILPTMVEPDGLSKRHLGGRHGAVPGYLLAKLALHERLRGATPKLGPTLLVDALEMIGTAADAAGGRLIVVDTLNARAHAFYLRADFQPIPETQRLVMRMSTAREALQV
jgi:hypothetical protein